MNKTLALFNKVYLWVIQILVLNNLPNILIYSFTSLLKRKRELNFNLSITMNDTKSISLKLAFKGELFE